MRRFPPYHAGKATDCNYIDKLAGRIIVFQNSPRMKNELPRLVRERWASCSQTKPDAQRKKVTESTTSYIRTQPFSSLSLIVRHQPGKMKVKTPKWSRASIIFRSGVWLFRNGNQLGLRGSAPCRGLDSSSDVLGCVGTWCEPHFSCDYCDYHVKQISLELLSTCRTGGKCRRSYKSNIHTGM